MNLVGNVLETVAKAIPELLLERVVNKLESRQIQELAEARELAEAAIAAPDMDELSSSKSGIYAEYNITPYNPDVLVGKKGISVYDKLRLDDQVKAVLATKKVARLSTNWKIVPHSDSPQDKEIADFVLWNFKQMDGTLESDLYEMMSALDYGYSVTEIVWRVIEEDKWNGKIGLKALKTRKPHNFNFQTDDHDNLDYITQSTDTQLPPHKFIVYSHQKEFDNFYGVSDLRAAYRNIFSKDVLIKFWNIWLERFPSPIMLGFYPQGTAKPIRDNLLNILKRVQIATAAVLPDNLEVDIRENTATGHQVFKEAIEFHNKSIARAILVPDLLGFTEVTGPGSYALGKKHFDIFILVLEWLGKIIEETLLLEQLIKRLVNYNWKVTGYPLFKFESLTEEGAEARAKIAVMLAAAHLIDPAEPWVRDYLRLPAPDQSHFTETATKKEFEKHHPPTECMTCTKVPTYEILWANGKGHAWFCTTHLKAFVKEHLEEGKEEGWALDINSVKIINDSRASTRFKDNLNPNIINEVVASVKGSKRIGIGAAKFQDDDDDRNQDNDIEDRDDWDREPRPLTIYEEKSGFNPSKLDKTIEDWVAVSSEAIALSVSDLITSVVKQVKSKKILGGIKPRVAYRLIQDIEINPRLIRTQSLNALMHAYFLGKEDGLNEVQKSLGRKLKFSESDPLDFADDITSVVPREALDKFAKRIPTPILKRDYGKMLQREKNKAFTIAGVIEKDTLGSVQGLLTKSVEGGWTLDEFERQVRDRAVEYTGSAYGRERTGEPLKAHHLETILRTNFSDIYNKGKKELYDDPDVRDYVPAFQFSAILDVATRENHAAMDGNVYPRGDAVWKIWWPPAGFNCRCTVIAVTENMEWSVSAPPTMTPDPGFGGLEEEKQAARGRRKPPPPPVKTPDEQAKEAREEIIRMSEERTARSREMTDEINGKKKEMYAARDRGDQTEFKRHSDELFKLRKQQRTESKAANEAIKSRLHANPKGTEMSIHNRLTGSQAKNTEKSIQEFTKFVDPKVLTNKTIVVNGTPKDRSYASNRQIYLGKRADRTTTFHEMGHFMEQSNPEVRGKAFRFLNRRTQGENAEWLGNGYDRRETYKKDRFLDKYMGKQYHHDTEIVSMGLQYMQKSPLTLARKDPDYFDFMWKTLRGM